jgi:anti-sigma factor RsiW
MRMSCKQVVELVTDYFEGTLSEEDRVRFERHLGECKYCTRYLEQMRVTMRTLGRIPEESLSDDARADLLHAFREWRGTG